MLRALRDASELAHPTSIAIAYWDRNAHAQLLRNGRL